MKKMFRIALGFICFMVIALIIFVASGHKFVKYWKVSRSETPVIFKLPNYDMFFIAGGAAESKIMEFKKDGNYNVTMRMHMGSMEWDKGTWSIDSNGDIAMKSTKHFHNIESDHMSISVTREKIPELFAVIDSLQIILKKTKKDIIPKAEFKSIKPYKRWDGQTVSLVGICNCEGHPTRKDVAKLISKISSYIESKDKNIFHYRPLTYKTFAYLVDLDAIYIKADKQIAEIISATERNKENPMPYNIYVAVSNEYYNFETGHPEPFKFVKPPFR